MAKAQNYIKSVRITRDVPTMHIPETPMKAIIKMYCKLRCCLGQQYVEYAKKRMDRTRRGMNDNTKSHTHTVVDFVRFARLNHIKSKHLLRVSKTINIINS